MKLESLTPVQAEAIPAALKKQDLLIKAKTGSGKTFAFLIPVIQRCLQTRPTHDGTRVLILAPTRELARQIYNQADKLSQSSRLQSGLITGGSSLKYQASMLRKNPEILVATPGRLLDHIERDNTVLEYLETLVIDEADRMLDMGLIDDVLTIVSHCHSDARQTLLLSATLKSKKLHQISGFLLKSPINIDIDDIRQSHSQIKQEKILADNYQHKCNLVARLLDKETYNRCLIFTNKREDAEKLKNWLSYKQYSANVLHGEINQDNRKEIMHQWRQGSFSILVATDLAARGLDVPDINLIVNFDIPRSGDEYIHRIGRTGRGDQTGLAISLVDHLSWTTMLSIESYLRLDMPIRKLSGLAANFQGLKKHKKRAVKKKPIKARTKQRQRDKKNIGKRRKPSAQVIANKEGGMSPPKKKKT